MVAPSIGLVLLYYASPDPKVCCQFDFLRLPGGRATCPWRVAPQPITARNVRERSETLVDQYRIVPQKSSIRRFVITEKAPTRAFSWLKAATTAFTFKTLC